MNTLYIHYLIYIDPTFKDIRFSHPAPVATQLLTQLFFPFEFNEDNLSTYSGEQSLHEQHQVNEVFDMVVNGQAAPSITNALNLNSVRLLLCLQTILNNLAGTTPVGGCVHEVVERKILEV